MIKGIKKPVNPFYSFVKGIYFFTSQEIIDTVLKIYIIGPYYIDYRLSLLAGKMLSSPPLQVGISR